MDCVTKEVLLDVEEAYALPEKRFEILSGAEDFLIKDHIVYPLYGGKELRLRCKSSETELRILSANDVLPEKAYCGKLFDKIELAPLPSLARRTDFIKAVDLSTLYEVLTHGGKFYNEQGKRESVFLMLKKGGFNTVRLRLWNQPYDEDGTVYGGGNNTLEVDLKLAKTAAAFGFDILLDFHYSDFWADPASQRLPKEWQDCRSKKDLLRAISTYTEQTLRAFLNCGIPVRYVQIGNEITNGLLIQPPEYKKNCKDKKLSILKRGRFRNPNFKAYLKAGIEAAKRVNPNILTILHIDTGANAKRSLSFFKYVKDVPYDIIGLSYYPFFHGEIGRVKETLQTLLKFQKPIMIAETSYAFTEDAHPDAESCFANAKSSFKTYPISPAGQAALLYDLSKLLLELPKDLGLGISWWEPCWLPLKGVGWSKKGTKPSWSDQALFSYDGVKLPSLDAFRQMTEATENL